MVKLTPNTPLASFAKDWPGFSIKETYKGELILLAVKNGEDKAFAAAFKKAYGKAPPGPNERAELKDGFVFWTGQGQYILMLAGENIHANTDAIAKLGGTAYATLQTDGWASLTLSGGRVFDVLERFVPLDLRGAKDTYAARTMAHHIAVIVLKYSDTDIQLLTPRSSAQSFLDGLVHTADLHLIS